MPEDTYAGLAPATTALDKTAVTSSRHPTPGSYPPISSIPRTSPERLTQAAEDASKEALHANNTVLYLAYGSNMCAQTFLGKRKIRPVSRINASAPTLRLTFDLPGAPYLEPCFANVGYRKLPEKPTIPDPLHPPILPPGKPPTPGSGWDDGLIGVVYEVTETDWHSIVKTEGGGTSYQEIIVPCLPLPADVGIPERSPFPSLPKPFLARTLFAPYIPMEKAKDKWWRRLFSGPCRSDPDYAQPSARYMKLLKDGAREHDLPLAYLEYLASIQSYAITSWRQRIGLILFIICWAPTMILAFGLSRLLTDDTGRVPARLAVCLMALSNVVWKSYDVIFKPIFGDGERTEESNKESMRRKLTANGTDVEKASLMGDGLKY